jgi:undecaprenyl-diphosphatase
MDLLVTAAFAALHGFTTVLPISESGHRVAASLWIDDGAHFEGLWLAAQLGTFAALLSAVWRRLGRAVSEGLRGIARPHVLQRSEGGRDAVALMIGSICAAATAWALADLRSHVNETPFVAALGLLATAAALACTVLAPPARRLAPTAFGALVVGVAHGLAILPGASRLAAAFVVLRWLGVGGWRAAEAAMMITLPVMALEIALGVLRPGVREIDVGSAALVLTLALVAGSLGASVWRTLCHKHRTFWLSLWLVPLALALLAYGRATAA